MNDILIETCNYIYKNPGLSKYRYIKDMYNRSIWRYSNVEDCVDYLSQTGVLRECKKYSSLYSKEYLSLDVNIIEYIKFYNPKFNDDVFVNILTYIFNHPKKSCKTYESNFSNMFKDDNINEIYPLNRRGLPPQRALLVGGEVNPVIMIFYERILNNT